MTDDMNVTITPAMNWARDIKDLTDSLRTLVEISALSKRNGETLIPVVLGIHALLLQEINYSSAIQQESWEAYQKERTKSSKGEKVVPLRRD